MNNFTKLILTTAVFATSGIEATIVVILSIFKVNSRTCRECIVSWCLWRFNMNWYYKLLLNTGKVNVYGNAYKEDSRNKDKILTIAGLSDLTVHTPDESNKGSIAETITVNPSDALNKTNTDLASYASGLDEIYLVYVASDGINTKCVGKTDSALEINASLANADAFISRDIKGREKMDH